MAPAPASPKVFDLSKTAPPAQTDESYDPLAEADMFVAYGRHERAMEVLRSALADDPEQMDIRLKLMEILATRDAQDDFLAEYDRVLALGSDDDVQVARTLAVETGHPHWLAELDAPGGIQSQGTVAAPTLSVTRSLTPVVEEDHAPELSSLDLDLQAPLAEPALDGLELELDAGLASDDGHDPDAGELPPLGDDDFGDLDLGSLDLEPGVASSMAPAEEEDALPLHDEPALALDAELSDALQPASGAAGALESLVPEPAPAPAETSAEDAADIDLLEGSDEVETRLELARAFIEMGDTEGARDILEEVVAEGSESQRAAAATLLQTLNPG
jgi:pilus assembly protein FimV